MNLARLAKPEITEEKLLYLMTLARLKQYRDDVYGEDGA